MRICLKFYFLVLFAGGSCFAQETTPKTDADLQYREDQFYVGASYNLVASVPNGVKLRGLSGGIQFGYLRDMPINQRRNLAVAIGAGFSFDQYGQNLFIGETANDESVFTVLDGDVSFDTNRFSMATVEVPMEFRWRTSTAESYKFWRIYMGFRVGYTYWYKATFKQPGNTVNQTKIPEFDNLRLGATLSFGYDTFNFFAYYSINPFFKNTVTTTGQTVDFRTLKLGLLFYIL